MSGPSGCLGFIGILVIIALAGATVTVITGHGGSSMRKSKRSALAVIGKTFCWTVVGWTIFKAMTIDKHTGAGRRG